jgi:hypothetical protein
MLDKALCGNRVHPVSDHETFWCVFLRESFGSEALPVFGPPGWRISEGRATSVIAVGSVHATLRLAEPALSSL